MKLIEQREQVKSGKNESETRNPIKKTGLCESRNTSTVMRDGTGTAAEPSSMKRSLTSMSCEETKNKDHSSGEPGTTSELGKLRIVKSIHTRILHSSAQKKRDSLKAQDEDDDSAIMNGQSAY